MNRRNHNSFEYTIALTGNANVGKSVIFNQLTGGSQIIGNWPGKTVEIAEGFIEHEGSRIKVVDLPGIYSLSAYSEEEIVAREFINKNHPDLVIVVVDASALYRNLFFLLQVLETGAKIIVALNQYDLLKDQGIEIDTNLLQDVLGIKVIKTIATKNFGLKELFEEAVKEIKGSPLRKHFQKYGREVQRRIDKLVGHLGQFNLPYEKNFVAIKLLEKDPEIEKLITDKNLLNLRDKLAYELEEIHGEPVESVIIQERYALASKIVSIVMKKKKKIKADYSEKLDNITLHRFFGYAILLGLLLFIFFGVFRFGSFFSGLISSLFENLRIQFFNVTMPEFLKKIVWNGFIEGFVAAFAIVLPYIVPFYILLSFLEDSGYLARIAFLTDAAMHRLGVHGKAFIPLIESFGCNVPAIMGTRVLERRRDRIIASILATFIPCSARSVVVFGLVAAFLGPWYAVMIYALDFVLIFALGLILNRFLKGVPSGLIMEMPRYRKPVLKIIFKQTWVRLKDFLVFAMPIIVVSNLIMEFVILLNGLNFLSILVKPFSFILGLPALATLTLLFGVLRKELTLIMLATFYGTTNFSSVLTPRQMLVFGFVTMIYIPCVATIAALKREFGKNAAIIITVIEFILALVLGGALNLVLGWFMR